MGVEVERTSVASIIAAARSNLKRDGKRDKDEEDAASGEGEGSSSDDGSGSDDDKSDSDDRPSPVRPGTSSAGTVT